MAFYFVLDMTLKGLFLKPIIRSCNVNALLRGDKTPSTNVKERMMYE